MKKKMNNAIGPLVRERAGEKKSWVVKGMVGVSVLAGMQTATQLFAHAFEYQPALGWSFHNWYAPWSIVTWGINWRSNYGNELMHYSQGGLAVTALGLVLTFVAKSVLKNTSSASEYMHGSARWAGEQDIRRAGLLPVKKSLMGLGVATKKPAAMGVYVGGWEDKKGHFHYLRHSGPEHILTYAPTRSGKGVGLVVPTLLSWPASAFITDLKGELWSLTSGWRKQHAGNKVIRFEPASAHGCARWNPLDEIRLGEEAEIGDVQNLVTLVVDPDGKGMDSHWQKTSYALLVGVVLHVLYKRRNEGTPASLAEVDAILADPEKDVASLWVEMSTYGHLPNGNSHPVVGKAASDMMNRPEEEAGSVLSTAKSYLSLYRDEVVARNISYSDWRVTDLMHHDDPVSLYVVTQPNDKSRLKPLVRILCNMVVRLLADKMDFENGRPKAHYKNKLLMMLDEFPSLGKLEILQESLAFVAGYGIKCYLICQDINQLKSRESGYGPDETITSNCHVQNAYPPNRIETAEHLSKLTGTTTVVKEQITTSGKRASAFLGSVSRTTQEVSRPLLTADECQRMPGPLKNPEGEIDKAGDMVIYAAGYPAIYGKQPLFFKDPIFLARSQISPPKQTDVTRRVVEPSEVKL